MAMALSSAGTKVSRAVLALPAAATKNLKGVKLIDAMHRSLYPHLYEGSAAMDFREVRQSRYTVTPHYKQVEAARAKSRTIWYRNKLRTSNKTVPKPQATRPIKKTCPDPISAITASQLTLLDPTGARTRLFAKDNPECARVGDILLVRQRTGEPFAGVCINIRRRGVDTAILLRGQLTRVGIEMWYKVYSPLVEGIEVVQRAQRKARRARLTYMRKEKHDRGSVENVVRVYLRQKAALGSAEGGKKGAAAAAAAAGGKKKGKKRGKKR